MNPLGYYPVRSDVILDPMCPLCVPKHADGACPPSCCAPWSLANAEPIFHDTESDTPTHCAECSELIPHALTRDGLEYVADAVTFGGGDPDVLRAWLNEYAVPVWGTYAGECSRCLDADAVVAFVDIDSTLGLAAWQVCADCTDGDALAPLGVACRECDRFGGSCAPYCVGALPHVAALSVCEACGAEYRAGTPHACGTRVACDECGADVGERCRTHCTGADSERARILQAVADIRTAVGMIRTGKGDPLALLDAAADSLAVIA